MEQIAQEKLQECEKEENKQGEQVMESIMPNYKFNRQSLYCYI